MIFFIEENMYKFLVDKNLTNLQLVEHMAKEKSTLLTTMTSLKLRTIHNKFANLIGYSGNAPYKLSSNSSVLSEISEKEEKRIIDDVNYLFTNTDNDNILDNNPDNIDKKYYDLVNLDNERVIVVFNKEILHILAEDKEKVIKLLLDILKIKYSFKSKYIDLLELYLQLKSKFFSNSMLKLRLLA